MTRGLALALVLALVSAAAPSAQGAPRFVDRAGDLPAPHVYDGGWEHFVGGGVAVLDCNGDAKPDLFVAGGANPARLLVNVTEGPGAPIRFVEGAPPPLPDASGVTGAYPLDVDGDGALDLAVLRVGPNALLSGGADCAFTDSTAAWGFEAGDRWSTAFAATWEPGRALPTLAVGNYVDRADPEGPFEACDVNELHRPEGAAYGAPILLEPGFCALSMLISDWSRSGTPELRVSNDRHYYVRGGYEQLWRLEPLEERVAADGWPRISLWGMGIASRDVTGDGLPEVMLTSMGDQLMKLNRGDGYENAPYSIGTYAQRPFLGDDGRPSTGWHAEFGDVDNDGRADLFIAKGNVDQMPTNAMRDPNNLLMQTPEGTFVEAAAEAGVATTERARGAALVDLDGDGRLDLVVVNRRAPLEIWQNETPETGAWLAVTPRQEGANGFAVGAYVEARTARGLQAQEVTVGGGHVGGRAGPLHFGLGPADAVEIRVIWPDGTASAWVPAPIGRRVEAWREGEGLALR